MRRVSDRRLGRRVRSRVEGRPGLGGNCGRSSVGEGGVDRVRPGRWGRRLVRGRRVRWRVIDSEEGKGGFLVSLEGFFSILRSFSSFLSALVFHQHPSFPSFPSLFHQRTPLFFLIPFLSPINSLFSSFLFYYSFVIRLILYFYPRPARPSLHDHTRSPLPTPILTLPALLAVSLACRPRVARTYAHSI